MSKINEVSHKSSGGFDGEHVAFGLLTGGAGFLAPPLPESHEVVVERGADIGVGHGSSHTAARADAIRDLARD